jgi:hypothetical protein
VSVLSQMRPKVVSAPNRPSPDRVPEKAIRSAA